MMLGREPIDLGPLVRAMKSLVELWYAEVPDNVSAFDSPKGLRAIEQSVLDFESTVGDYADQENDVRRALAWLLNSSDDVVADLFDRGQISFPTKRADDRRRFLELAWTQTFGTWQIPAHFPVDCDVVGHPGRERP